MRRNTLGLLKTLGLRIPMIILILCFFFGLWKIPQLQVQSLPAGEKRIELENSNRATLAQILGGAFVLAGLYFTWQNLLVSKEAQITDRFTKSIELLGSKEQDIRLGGIYSLERIANDSPKDYWTIIEILTSFVREKSKLKKTEKYREKPIYSVEIQAILNILGRRNTQRDAGREIDLSNSDLSGFTIPLDSDFSRAVFRNSVLKKTRLQAVTLTYADFSDADLTEASLNKARLQNTIFNNACLNCATVKYANLDKAKLDSSFVHDADFRESSLKQACFDKAHLQGARFNKTVLDKSTFTDADFHDDQSWEKRYWSEEDHYREDLYYEQDGDYCEQDGDYDEDYVAPWKIDFRGSNLTIEQAKSAKNWAEAIYNDSLRKELELPPHEKDDIRYDIRKDHEVS
jgi:uncharacterized protein YjbI with pentapeptide repeats